MAGRVNVLNKIDATSSNAVKSMGMKKLILAVLAAGLLVPAQAQFLSPEATTGALFGTLAGGIFGGRHPGQAMAIGAASGLFLGGIAHAANEYNYGYGGGYYSADIRAYPGYGYYAHYRPSGYYAPFYTTYYGSPAYYTAAPTPAMTPQPAPAAGPPPPQTTRPAPVLTTITTPAPVRRWAPPTPCSGVDLRSGLARPDESPYNQ